MKSVVCGGHPNMPPKLKEWMPDFEFIDTETLGKNFSYLSNYDVVYFYPNWANHSFYEKVKPAIKGSKTKFIYLQDGDNVELIIKDMYKNITDENLSL
ncbi:hypothetical protein ACFY4F_00440 [Peribacillus butanolivorans]|uniref:hypothetical protein n=1 Tax=Peribacillus butanolivorans TaxID=421767 RepID=UPI00367F583C